MWLEGHEGEWASFPEMKETCSVTETQLTTVQVGTKKCPSEDLSHVHRERLATSFRNVEGGAREGCAVIGCGGMMTPAGWQETRGGGQGREPRHGALSCGRDE